MKNKLLSYLIVGIVYLLYCGILYLAGCFIVLSFDPHNWNGFGRFLYVTVVLCSIPFVGILAIHIQEDFDTSDRMKGLK